ncbi:MAG: glucose 1-dehydrogenase [Acidimicrobiales bacterium]
MARLDGRVAVISGASRGQGEAEARAFVAEGASVIMGDGLDDLGETVARDLGERCRYVHLDVRSEEAWSAAVDLAVSEFGKLDALVNNAGILRFFPIKDCSVEAYMEVISVNQVGCLLGMKAVVGAMESAGGGTIVNVSSVNGMVGLAGTVAYSSSKFAVRGMTKVAALELGPLGIRVNSIHPGGVDTPMVSPESLPGMGAEGAGAAYRRLPLRRIGRPEEMASLAVFLTSEESSYCTGAEFLADGGMLAGLPGVG